MFYVDNKGFTLTAIAYSKQKGDLPSIKSQDLVLIVCKLITLNADEMQTISRNVGINIAVDRCIVK